MIGQSVPMRRIMEAIERVAPARVSVFITGETGTGKEEAAKAIHERSGRTGPFVPVNCAAIIETLIESELFGHQKGSFTGADRRHPGLVERANGGTLFLDEISEMRSEAQAKLLRVIEERRVLPVGGTQEIPIDVRFLAASNRAPKQAIGEERLREDLYYRLCAATIHLPPLRDRLEDLPALIDHFLTQANHDYQRQVDSIDPECLCALKTYRWPGNVRELRNVFDTAVLMTHSTRLSVEDLPEEINLHEPGNFFHGFFGIATPRDRAGIHPPHHRIRGWKQGPSIGNAGRPSPDSIRETRALRRSTQIQRPI